eukprot:TRINITY_DN6593_c0_g1_i1.p1 TRINITY_DN6593_c0_g1~~TRINITY_DN6593_c0_g1_i1.p1  ORF type:complete len:395 (-),score=48.41 TRINITY_DN6593_c0_g1_i1:108-1292(-)
MAHTAHQDLEQVKEHFDSIEVLEEKARKVVELIRKSKGRVVAFTGAGVSTSAGIADFRGPEGVWTLRAQGKSHQIKSASALKSIPTKTHMALLQLLNVGILDIIISQNTDGLHRKSGVPANKIAELHGNTNLEICEDCATQYLRDYRTRISNSVNDHYTGRNCSVCKGRLKDTIINFGESLPEDQLELAWERSQRAVLCIVLGSSLTVSPANLMPPEAKNLVICNLQKTHLDKSAKVRVYARCDDFVELVMDYLGLEIPPFCLQRYVEIAMKEVFDTKTTSDNLAIQVRAVDSVGIPASIFSKVEIFDAAKSHWAAPKEREPFLFLRLSDQINEESVIIRLSFMGHYGEPSLDLTIPLKAPNESQKCMKKFLLEFHPANLQWFVKDLSPCTSTP